MTHIFFNCKIFAPLSNCSLLSILAKLMTELNAYRPSLAGKPTQLDAHIKSWHKEMEPNGFLVHFGV